MKIDHHVFTNCFLDWCRTNQKSASYEHIEEFNSWLEKKYELVWPNDGDVEFKNPEEATEFLLRYS